MIKFFRRIREKLIAENKFSKYLIYAIGEILLVVIGILIALQIDNWNDEQKRKAAMITNIKSIGADIQSDIYDLQKTNSSLNEMNSASRAIIPIMESKDKIIADSLKFIIEFNSLTTTPIISERSNTWNFLNSSGVVSEFPDAKLLKLLQDYYKSYNDVVVNFTNSGIPVILELRKLKYELFKDSEHRKFFPTSSPEPPGVEVYDSIFEDTRVLPLCRFIGSTANYFEKEFSSVQSKAEKILAYIDGKYRKNKKA